MFYSLLRCFFPLLPSGRMVYDQMGKIELNADDDHIKASTRTANVLLDKKTGEVNFVVLIKGFEFSQAGMQEKFNKQLMESENVFHLRSSKVLLPIIMLLIIPKREAIMVK